MKIHTVLLCSILATTTSVVARASEVDLPLSAQASGVPGKTRAEVKAETLRALAAGEVSFGDVGYPREPGATPRARVRAKAVSASPTAMASGRPAS